MIGLQDESQKYIQLTRKEISHCVCLAIYVPSINLYFLPPPSHYKNTLALTYITTNDIDLVAIVISTGNYIMS